EVSAAVLGPRRALAAADPCHDAAADALDEVAFDRAAVPSQGSRRPADRARTEMTGMLSRRRGSVGFGIFTALMVVAFAGLGTWAFLPARLPAGETVVVNTGFVQNTMQDRSQQDRAVSRFITGQSARLTGYIRFPERAGALTPPENIAKRLWFTRDHLSM